MKINHADAQKWAKCIQLDCDFNLPSNANLARAYLHLLKVASKLDLIEWTDDLDETCCDTGRGECHHCMAWFNLHPGRGGKVTPKQHHDDCPFVVLNAILKDIKEGEFGEET